MLFVLLILVQCILLLKCINIIIVYVIRQMFVEIFLTLYENCSAILLFNIEIPHLLRIFAVLCIVIKLQLWLLSDGAFKLNIKYVCLILLYRVYRGILASEVFR